MEQWKVIIGFINYEVSDCGRVRNRKTGRILKTSIDHRGNEVVCLSRHGQQFVKKVHILVAETFVDNYCKGDLVIHIDGDKLNNYANNLDWSNRSIYTKRLNRRRRSMGIDIPHTRRIRVIETDQIFESISEASLELGLSISSISKCLNFPYCRNRLGYHFEEIL